MTRYVLFAIGGQSYAAPVSHVVEVLHLVDITPVPNQADDQLGVVTLSGKTLPVLDLRYRYTGQRILLTVNTPMLVLRSTGGSSVIIVADAVQDVITLKAQPEDVPEPEIQGVFRYEDDTVILPDVDALIDAVRQ